MSMYDLTRSRKYEDKCLRVTEKIGTDPLPKEEKVISTVSSLRNRKQMIEDELKKTQDLLQQREAKVIRSLQRNKAMVL